MRQTFLSGTGNYYVHVGSPFPPVNSTVTTSPKTNNLWFRDEDAMELLWWCNRCGATQIPSDVSVTEIVEPGKEPRIEFYGKIRPTSFDDFLEFECLVCGNVWHNFHDEDPGPDEPETKSNVFKFPIYENSSSSCCISNCSCCDRDAC